MANNYRLISNATDAQPVYWADGSSPTVLNDLRADILRGAATIPVGTMALVHGSGGTVTTYAMDSNGNWREVK